MWQSVASFGGWFTQRDDIKSIMKLCQFGRVDLKAIIDETYLPENCQEVYTRLINDPSFPVVSQFDWRNIR